MNHLNQTNSFMDSKKEINVLEKEGVLALRAFGSFRFLSITFCFLFSVLCLLCFDPIAYANEAAKILEEMPIQHGGRVKPFQSFAREAALNILGSENYSKKSAAELYWSWLAKPEDWNNKAMITVPSVLRGEFGVMVVRGRISPEMIINHKPFREKVQAAVTKRSKRETLTQIEKKRIELYDRAAFFQDIATGAAPGWIAHPDDPRAGWLPFQGLSAEQAKDSFITRYPVEQVAQFMKTLGALVDAWQQNPQSPETTAAAKAFSQAQRNLFQSASVMIDQEHLNTEVTYNRLHAFGWAWKAYLVAAVFFALAMMMPGGVGKIAAGAACTVWAGGFIVHLVGFILRCMIAGRPPVTNMYESIIWVSFTAVFFAMILLAVYRAVLIPLTASLVAAFALVIAETFPVMLDPGISPLVPVLRSNLWLTIHVLTITMSYGAFALAWGLGHAVVIGYARDPFQVTHLKNISGFLYRSLQIGVILLAAGTILGGVWANYSWGRFWGWDPKETWALIALLGYLAVLHGRYAKWLDTFDAAAASVIAFAGVVMAWYGVNYVLAAGLHSYGFGGGGAPYVMAVMLADIALMLVLRMIYKKKINLPASKA